ncbi:MAG TPA: hypothetical protein VF340_05620 [Methyloceanibacter sp.]
MLKTTLLRLATAATLSLGAAALTPALANYGHCGEEPDSADCRTYNMPGFPSMKESTSATQPSARKPVVHAHSHQGPVRSLPQKG